ncbi:MAG: hypothetical protein ACOCRO_02290 [Halanaerobiales bacterium]
MKVSERLLLKCPTCQWSTEITKINNKEKSYYCPWPGCIREDGHKICIKRNQKIITKKAL